MMDGNGVAMIIAAIGGLITVITTSIIAVLTYQNGKNIKQVAHQTDGINQLLIEKASAVSRQDGFEAGQADPTAMVDTGRPIPVLAIQPKEPS